MPLSPEDRVEVEMNVAGTYYAKESYADARHHLKRAIDALDALADTTSETSTPFFQVAARQAVETLVDTDDGTTDDSGGATVDDIVDGLMDDASSDVDTDGDEDDVNPDDRVDEATDPDDGDGTDNTDDAGDEADDDDVAWCGRCGYKSNPRGVAIHNGRNHDGDAIVLEEEPDPRDLTEPDEETPDGEDESSDSTEPADADRGGDGAADAAADGGTTTEPVADSTPTPSPSTDDDVGQDEKEVLVVVNQNTTKVYHLPDPDADDNPTPLCPGISSSSYRPVSRGTLKDEVRVCQKCAERAINYDSDEHDVGEELPDEIEDAADDADAGGSETDTADRDTVPDLGLGLPDLTYSEVEDAVHDNQTLRRVATDLDIEKDACRSVLVNLNLYDDLHRPEGRPRDGS